MKNTKFRIVFVLLVLMLTALAFSACSTFCKHKETKRTSTSQPTCTTDGAIRFQCTKCTQIFSESIPAIGHDYEYAITKQPTCTELGIKTYSCTRCDQTYDQSIPSLTHNYVDTITKQPTCTEQGQKMFACTHCDDAYTESLPLASHSYTNAITKQPTCTEQGERTYSCETCSRTYTESIAKLSHNYTSSITKQPTCSDPGTKTYKCERCNDVYNETITAPHNYEVSVTKHASCTQAGEKTYRCADCNDTYAEVVPALPHELTSTNTKLPDCTTAGSVTHQCNNCNYFFAEEIPSLGHHVLTLAAVEATCTATGLTKGEKCSRCDQNLIEQTIIPIAPHNFHQGTCANCKTVQTCVVSFDTNCDVVASQTYNYGQSFVFPTDPQHGNDVFLGWFTANDSKYEGGTITEDLQLYAKWDVSLPISTAEQLLAIKTNPSGTYELANDINLNGTIWQPIDEFCGILNGNGFTIKNFVLNTTSVETFGMFRVNSGTIKNLSLADFTFTVSVRLGNTPGYFGAVAGINNGELSHIKLTNASFKATTEKVLARDSFTGYLYLGQLTANNTGTIAHCSSAVDLIFDPTTRSNETIDGYYGSSEVITMHHYVGGIAGLSSGEIKNSDYTGSIVSTMYASRGGDVNDTINNIAYIGGIVGYNKNGYCNNSFVTAQIDIKSNNNKSCNNQTYTGLVAGANYDGGSIKQSYAKGQIKTSINSTCYVGGFIGINANNSDIASCYSDASLETANVSNVGGFVGTNAGIVQNSYSAGNISSETSGSIGGFAGALTNSGSISKSYACVDISAVGSSVGFFVGSASGTVLKCYFMEGSIVKVDGKIVTSVIEYNTIEGKLYPELWNESFLIDQMYWEEEGWVVIVDDNPLLSWEIDASHDFVTHTFEPTCDYGGFTAYSCNHCSRMFVNDYVDPLGHDFETTTSIPPSCFLEGYTLVTCKTCAHEEKINILPATGHLLEDAELLSEQPATCTADGVQNYHCAECNNNYSITITKLGHIGTFVEHTTLSTCTNKGIDTYSCSRCNSNYTVDVECIPHTPVTVNYLAPTCTMDNGFLETTNGNFPGEKCETCNNVLWGCETIEPHNYVLTQTITPATCTTAGKGGFECSICQHTEERILANLEHTDTNRNNICDVCDAFTFTSIPASLFTEVSTAQQLSEIRNNLTKYFILTQDIDLSGMDWTPIGTEDKPFKGILFGNGHKITGLKIEQTDAEGIYASGLFGYNSGTIVNITIDSLTCTIKNVNANKAKGLFADAGGVVAHNKGNVLSCNLIGTTNFVLETRLTVTDYAKYAIITDIAFGGICGHNDLTGKISNCVVSGEFDTTFVNRCAVESSSIWQNLWSLVHNTQATTTQSVAFGGVCGENKGIVENCDTLASFTNNTEFGAHLSSWRGKAFATSQIYAGGFVGINTGTISNSTSTVLNLSITEGVQYENKQSNIIGRLYEYGRAFYNHSKLEGGVDGLVGNSVGVITNLIAK